MKTFVLFLICSLMFTGCVSYDYGKIHYAEINYVNKKQDEVNKKVLKARCSSGGLTFFDNMYDDLDAMLKKKQPDGINNYEAGSFDNLGEYGIRCIAVVGEIK